ncbi:receptor-like protein EIX2 [Humulus lupulus]|uniref:receptor-like protein EIX2 n=1 Tax=Humulus lupulus TaxID=3486 RepID=UPI002B40B3A8|nr:receptor-like protein EIX2 [Humulus lupulus]
MVEDYYDPKTIFPSIPVVTTTPGVGFDDSYINTASIIWKGTHYEYDKNLGLLRIIDLSNNKLNGEIPIEVSYLSQLRQLNLSCNNFSGAIPRNIGNLNKLELLDLSRNKVFGEIPTSLAEISSLNYLDLSNNRLSGRIPTGTQLQTFDPSRYTMNFGLCGPPISRSCPGDEPYVPQSPANDSDQGAHDEDGGEWINLLWFYIGIGIGFTIGFCGVFGSLVINTSWRHAYFRFMHYLSDWLYVMINVKWALLWRKHSWH